MHHLKHEKWRTMIRTSLENVAAPRVPDPNKVRISPLNPLLDHSTQHLVQPPVFALYRAFVSFLPLCSLLGTKSTGASEGISGSLLVLL